MSAYQKQQQLLIKLGTPPPRYLVPIKDPKSKGLGNIGFIHKSFKEMSPRELRQIDSFHDPNYSPGSIPLSERRLAKKKGKKAKKASKIKNEFKTRIEMVVRNLRDMYQGGDLDGFEKSWPEEEFAKKVINRIACVNIKKTNRKQNFDQIYFKKNEKNCVDLSDKRFKPMKDFLEKKLKYPKSPDWYSKDFNIDDYFDETVLEFLDEVSSNLNNKAEFKEKE
jgi:hypothetical protein